MLLCRVCDEGFRQSRGRRDDVEEMEERGAGEWRRRWSAWDGKVCDGVVCVEMIRTRTDLL